MDINQSDSMDSFFSGLADDYEANRLIHAEIKEKAGSIIERKAYKDLPGLVSFAKKPHFHASKETRVFFLTISSLVEEITSEKPLPYLDSINGFNELVAKYRYVTLLLRRLETFSYEDPEFDEAIRFLAEINPPYRLVDTILSNELFQFKEFVALNFYFEIVKNRELSERMDCIKLFSVKYPASEWSVEISEIIKELENGNK